MSKSFYLNSVEVSTLTSSNFKLTDEEWKIIIKVMLSGGKDGVEDMLALAETSKVKELIAHDLLINSIYNFMFSHMRTYKLDTSDIHQLRVSYLDFGWDYYIDALEISIRYITGPDLEDQSSLINDLNRLKTINLFEYYNKFATIMTKELESIFGFAQECYLGFDGDGLWIGFDIANGSIIAPMPIGGTPRFIFEGNPMTYPSTGEVLIHTKPKIFYGKGPDHFFDTEKGYCNKCHIDIRLD